MVKLKKTLMASIHPNNKDILQILLAITYFTSCIKKKETNIRLIPPRRFSLNVLASMFVLYVHCGLVVSFFLFSGWHLSSSDKVALFVFRCRLDEVKMSDEQGLRPMERRKGGRASQTSTQLCSTMAVTLFSYSLLFSW